MDCHTAGLIWTDWKRTWNRSVVASHKFLKCCTKKGKPTTLLLSNWIIAQTTERNLLCYTCNSEYWFLSLKLCNFLVSSSDPTFILSILIVSDCFQSPSVHVALQWSSTAPRHCTNTLGQEPPAQQLHSSEGTELHHQLGLDAFCHCISLSSGCFSDSYGTETKQTILSKLKRWKTRPRFHWFLEMSPQMLLGMCSKMQLICHTINLIHPCPNQQRTAKPHEHSTAVPQL